MKDPKDRGWLHRRLVEPLLAQLKQGVTPAKLAWSLSLGVGLGCCPVLGSTTLLCFLAALAFKLNQPAIQLVNYLAYPLQLALLIPFLQAGQRLFGEAPLPLTLERLQAELQAGALPVIARYAGATARGVVVWALVVPLAVVALRFVLGAVLARLLPRAPGNSPAGEP
jgi:uncharacterized protein (DUF2062 family)